MTIIIGAKLPHTGDIVTEGRIPQAAVLLEQAGFESLWVSDHIVLPQTVDSRYPFDRDGVARWRTDVPYVEALTALAAAAAVTRTVRLGTAVLVLPLRNPVLLAKQTASIAALAPGRVRLGVGAGWLREEFEALGAVFEGRGAQTAHGIRELRSWWAGARGELLMLPSASVPIYPGGHAPAALRRAGRLGDGWLGQQSLSELDPVALASDIGAVRAAAAAPDHLHMVLRIVESTGRAEQLADRLPELAAAGVHEIIVDSDPFGDPRADVELLRSRAG